VASLANPYFYRLHVHVWQYVSDPYQSQHIMEFLSLSFHHPAAIFFEGMLLLSAATAFWCMSRGASPSPAAGDVGARGAAGGAQHSYLHDCGGATGGSGHEEWLALLPELRVAEWVRSGVRKFNSVAAETSDTDSIPRWHLASVAGAAVVAALLYAPSPPERFRAEFDPKSFPAAGRREAAPRSFGAHLHLRPMGRLPDLPSVSGHQSIRGRPQRFLRRRFRRAVQGSPEREIRLGEDPGRFRRRHDPAAPSAPLAGALKESSRWRVVYDDGVALVFRSAHKTAGESISAATGGGTGRDREVTKTEARDRAIAKTKPNNLGVNIMTYLRTFWKDEQGRTSSNIACSWRSWHWRRQLFS